MPVKRTAYGATMPSPSESMEGDSDSRMNLQSAMGIIELFEITIAFCTVWIVVSAVLSRFREGR
jgi:hypothetical protein